MRKSIAAFGLCLIALGFSVSRSPAAELSPGGKKALRFLTTVRRALRNYHINGKEHEPKVYVKAAWEAMIRFLEAGKMETIEEEHGKILIEALRKAKMADLERLVTLLDRFAGRVEGVQVEKLAEIGAHGMFLPLEDPFSRLIDLKRLQKMMQAMTSTVDKSLGVGPLRTREGEWKIGHVRCGFPAGKSGLKIGDKILAINGEPITAIPPTEVGKRLRAEKGEAVKITVRREGWKTPHTFVLVQDQTTRRNVQSRLLPGKVGYIRMLMFNANLAQDMEKALGRLEDKGMRGLILDLRGNPGGALPSCVAVADMFLMGGQVIAHLDSRHPMMGGRRTYRSRDRGTRPEYPLVVLINQASASASEMLSGALKNNERALVVGETSYGKGVGQSPIPLGARLSHHKSLQFLYLTHMQYFLPGGTIVQHKGVEPHIREILLEHQRGNHEKMLILREGGELLPYAQWAASKHGDFFRKAVGFSRIELRNFPGLVRTFQQMESPALSTAVLTMEIFRAIRLALEKTAEKPIWIRPREDRVLCRGVFEISQLLKITAREVPEYTFIFHLFR
ncbi:MAG: S41 family peptidase [Planctomycetota bacterium]